MNPLANRIRPLRAVAAVAAATLAGCGGGGSSGGGQPPVTLSIEGPAATDAPSVVVHGVAQAGLGLVAVTVGGVAAVSGDGFATFSATVPLALGANRIDVVASSARRVVARPVAQITRETTLLHPVSGVAFDASHHHGLVAAVGLTQELFFVDATTGARTLLADPNHGAGGALGTLDGPMAFEADGSALLVDTDNPSSILVVDPVAGDRTRLARSVVFAEGLAHDPLRDRAVYTDSFFAETVRALNLTSASDVVVSDGTDGKLPPMTAPGAVGYDSDADRYVVVDAGAPALLRVVPASGDRSLLSDFANASQGPTIAHPIGLALDVVNRFAYTLSIDSNDLIAVDLDSGLRTLVVPGDASHGPAFTGAAVFDCDSDTSRVYAPAGAAVMVFDTLKGTRTLLGDVRIGTGDGFTNANAIAFDPVRGRVLFVTLGSAFAVSLATGDRSVLIDNRASAGPVIANTLDVDAVTGALVVYDFARSALVEVDATTLQARTVSDPAHGSGPSLGFVQDVAIDHAGGRFFALDESFHDIVSIDAKTGDRSILAQVGDGKAVTLTGLIAVGFDAPTGRVLAMDVNQAGFVVIDPATGDRSHFADVPQIGMPLVPKSGFVVDAATHAAFAFDGNFLSPSVVRVDLDDASRTTVTSSFSGSGPALLPITALASDGARGRVFALDNSIDALLQVDVESGDRVVISR
jgi:sugar lactone lactonase YvrE